jgi:hypothetical protein
MFGNSLQRVVGSPPVAEFDKPANSVERIAHKPLLRRLSLPPPIGTAPPQQLLQIPPLAALLHLATSSGVPAATTRPPPSAHLGPPDQCIIVRMRAYPKPLEAIVTFDGDCAVPAANAHRPQVSADAFEVQRRMFRIALQLSEVPVRDRTNIGRQGIEQRLEPRVLDVPHARAA